MLLRDALRPRGSGWTGLDRLYRLRDGAAGRTSPRRHLQFSFRHVECHPAFLASQRHHLVLLGSPREEPVRGRRGLGHDDSSLGFCVRRATTRSLVTIARTASVVAPTPSRYETGSVNRNDRAISSSSMPSSISSVDSTLCPPIRARSDTSSRGETPPRREDGISAARNEEWCKCSLGPYRWQSNSLSVSSTRQAMRNSSPHENSAC